MTSADEMRALRAHNDALQKQLALKDQGLERLRQKVHERALMLSHQQAADVQQTRREAGSMVGELEAGRCDAIVLIAPAAEGLASDCKLALRVIGQPLKFGPQRPRHDYD